MFELFEVPRFFTMNSGRSARLEVGGELDFGDRRSAA